MQSWIFSINSRRIRSLRNHDLLLKKHIIIIIIIIIMLWVNKE